MEEKTTQELMNQISDRLILNLAKGEKVCPTCKGLRFVLVQRGKNTYIENCRDCYNGKNYVCEHCGKLNKTDHCDCEGAENERELKAQKEEYKRFVKAEKINYEDYDGLFLWNERAIEKEDLEEELYEILCNGEEPQKYIYATKKECLSVGIDIADEISNRCADEGYEDMEDYVDLDSEKLKQAQKLIDEWVQEQGSSLDTYYEDYSKVIMLDEVIERLRQELKNK